MKSLREQLIENICCLFVRVFLCSLLTFSFQLPNALKPLCNFKLSLSKYPLSVIEYKMML